MGQKYTTQFNQTMDIKLINLSAWENLKLAKINIDITTSNQQLSIKSLQENIAANYFNILNLQQQIKNANTNLLIADTLYQIAENKYNNGLVKQQDVNDSRVNVLNNKENIEQLNYLLRQYYLSLKILCDIPENENISIEQKNGFDLPLDIQPSINTLSITNSLLKEKYALANYNQVKKTLTPTLSFNFNQSYTLYNQNFKLFDGKWFPGESIGFKLSVPMPNATTISNKYKARYEYELSKKQQNRKE